MIKRYFFILLFILIFSDKSIGLENKIIFKINNEIITSLDLESEIKYLTALNPNLRKLNQVEINELSKKSIIQEKIKKIEIYKYFKNPKISKEFLEQMLKNVYSKIGINELKNFQKYLELNEIDYDVVLTKIETEALWNELIISKFSNKLKIDEVKLKKKIQDNINSDIKSYLMSEIFFEVGTNEKIEIKYNEISTFINNEGFDNAALKYSISASSRIGGKLNWINENSLNENIRKVVNSMETNEFSKPITMPGGFLILQINEIKLVKSKKNIEKELEKLIRAQKNNQLNQFSKMYFNKIRENTEINEI